jgi:hypothetical protein
MVTIISFRLKSKSLLQKELYGDLKKASNPSKMASDQNEKRTIGISKVKSLVLGNYSPPPLTTRKITFLHR